MSSSIRVTISYPEQLALGKLNFSCAVIGLTFSNRVCRQRTGTPKFRGSGCQFPQSQCHPSPRTGIALGTRLSVSLNNEKICCEISEDKIAVCEKTAGLRCGKFSDLNSACSKVLVPIKIFQFQDMLNENRFLGTFRGHSKRPTFDSVIISLGFNLLCFQVAPRWTPCDIYRKSLINRS